MTATSAWAFGQWNWYAYETAPEPFSDVVRYCSHCGGNDGILRDDGSESGPRRRAPRVWP